MYSLIYQHQQPRGPLDQLKVEGLEGVDLFTCKGELSRIRFGKSWDKARAARFLKEYSGIEDPSFYQIAPEQRLLVCNKNESKMQVFGWAYMAEEKDGTPVKDISGIDYHMDDLEPAIYDWIGAGYTNIGVQHEELWQGTVIESVVVTREKEAIWGLPPNSLPVAVWLGIQLWDAETYLRVLSGELRGLSLAGLIKLEKK